MSKPGFQSSESAAWPTVGRLLILAVLCVVSQHMWLLQALTPTWGTARGSWHVLHKVDPGVGIQLYTSSDTGPSNRDLRALPMSKHMLHACRCGPGGTEMASCSRDRSLCHSTSASSEPLQVLAAQHQETSLAASI